MGRATALTWCLAVGASVYLAARLAPVVDGLSAVGDYDTAEYYVVARNFARGDGLTDTLRWHHLGPSPDVIRPAGDFHSAFWPLALGSLMAIFGSSQKHALWIVFALGLFLPPLVFFVSRRTDSRSPWIAPTIAAVTVASLGRLHPTLVTPDITLSYQLATMGGLCAWMSLDASSSRRARVLAGVALMSPLLFRGEGFVLVGAATLVMLFESAPWRVRLLERIAPVVAGAAIVWLVIGLYSLASFGSFTPRPRSLTLVMTSYADIFSMTKEPSFDTWWGQGLGVLWAQRTDVLAQHVESITSQLPRGLLVFGAMGAVVAVARRNGRAIAVALFVAFTVLVPILLVPIVASRDRVVLNIAPPLVVLTGVVIAEIDARTPRHFAWLPGALVGLLAVAWHPPFEWLPDGKLRAFGHYAKDPIYDQLAEHVPKGSVVISEDPWAAAVHLDVAAAHIPGDGREGIVKAIETYHPGYVLTIVNTPRDRIMNGLSSWIESRTVVGWIIVYKLRREP